MRIKVILIRNKVINKIKITKIQTKPESSCSLSKNRKKTLYQNNKIKKRIQLIKRKKKIRKKIYKKIKKKKKKKKKMDFGLK